MANVASTHGFDPYQQILANVRFFSPEHAYVRIVTAREPSADRFRVAVVREVDMGRHREVVLSETAISVHLALRALHLRSAEAVHSHITMYGFDFPPEAKVHLRENDIWASDDEVASGFSVDESTVAFSGVISNDGFSDNDDVAADFEDEERKDAEEIVKIAKLFSELGVAGDENQEPRIPFPELKVTLASPPTPTANSSKRKARKVRAPKSRSRYNRSRSRSKSSASRQPLQARDSVPEPPVRPPGFVTAAAINQARQQRLNAAAANFVKGSDSTNPTPGALFDQVWDNGNGPSIPFHTMHKPPVYPGTGARPSGPGVLPPPPPPPPAGSPLVPPGRQLQYHPDLPPGHPLNSPALQALGYNAYLGVPRDGPIPSPPGPPLGYQPPGPPQPKPSASGPTFYDVRLRITTNGHGTARIFERCPPSRRAIIDRALAYVRAHPGIFGGLQAASGPGGAIPVGGVNERLRRTPLRGNIKQAWFKQTRNGVVCDESYDMTTYVGNDLTKLFEPATGAIMFDVEVWSAGFPGPIMSGGHAPGAAMKDRCGPGQNGPFIPGDPRVVGAAMGIPVGFFDDFASDTEEIIDD